MNELLTQLLEIKEATKELQTIEKRYILEHYRLLERVATLSGRSTFHCRIPESAMNIEYITEFSEFDLGEVVARQPVDISVDNSIFQKHLECAITLAQELL